MVVTRDNLLQVNLAEALNRTNQAMGSEKKLDGGKKERLTHHMQPIQDSGQVYLGDSTRFVQTPPPRVSGCEPCLRGSAGKITSQKMPCCHVQLES